MEIYALSEGNFIAKDNHTLVPLHTPNTVGMTVGVNPFLLHTREHISLLDTGIGMINPQSGQLILSENLARYNISPSAVTQVFFSHLHYDHISGAIPKHTSFRITFPNATHYIHKKDFQYTLADTHIPNETKERLLFLTQHAKIFWITENNGTLSKYITYGVTHGHCPFHIHYFINDEKGIIFFGGDEAPQYHQMRMRIIPKYDYNGKESARLRHEWHLQAQKEKWTYLFYHDTSNPIHKIV